MSGHFLGLMAPKYTERNPSLFQCIALRIGSNVASWSVSDREDLGVLENDTTRIFLAASRVLVFGTLSNLLGNTDVH
jgi:hypothetical protein